MHPWLKGNGFDITQGGRYCRAILVTERISPMNAAKMKSSAVRATTLLKGLANEHRLLILCHLANGEKSVSELETLLRMRQPHLSQHLARLRRDALVTTRRDSRSIYYRLGSSAAAKVIRLLYDLYCSRSGTAARGQVRKRAAAAVTTRGRARRG